MLTRKIFRMSELGENVPGADDDHILMNAVATSVEKTRMTPRGYMNQLKANLKIEWEYFKTPCIFIGITVGGIAQFLHNACHNYVYYLAGHFEVYGGPANQLVDLGFKALPDISTLSFLPSNGCLYSLGSIAAVVAISPILTDEIFKTHQIRTVQIVWRAILVCSIGIVLRCVSFLITILPAPAPQCTAVAFNPPKTASEIFFIFDTENGCSDLIFSSHMMYGIIATGIVCHYLTRSLKRSDVPRKEKLIKCGICLFCVAVVIAEGFCIVAQNRHYSVDVWTSAYAIPLTWIAFDYFVPADPVPRRRRITDNNMV